MLLRRDRAMTGILIMLDVAFHAGRSGTVNAADIATRAGLARRGIEPLLQTLSRSSLLESVRGPRGGYRLGRPRRDISLADIVSTIIAPDSEGEEGSTGDLFTKVLDPFWREEDQKIVERFRDLTLDDLVRKAEAAGLRRPMAEPIMFSI
ncbi:Rrf2 family transcriptional regulator [Acetobacter estunensis]|uniref:RrF2 family transcriptional regulator n=1 Tax=Acetobacter estunensis TaxID=104097 RepID=UPI001C2D9378|nr:Rrf2 family transcriptional regulator [Acetobacter estunensis]MBV1835846.1 Rrf2 family transcriptional regulator [Acetobacter estunensis]MBV1835893.1 Rrf2 family transcriptional regulator [Acetobacter estunensis]